VAVNEALADALIAAGAFGYLDTLSRLGLTDQQTDAALIRRYGGPGRVDADTAYFVVVQYQLFRQAGEAIERATNPDVPYTRHLPQIAGCEGRYEYVVVVPFHNDEEDEDTTKPFTIRSDVPLSWNDLQVRAAELAAEVARDNDTLFSASGSSSRWKQDGLARVTAAARCL
jgi:hypothetical protein